MSGLLLDTNTLLFLTAGSRRIGAGPRRRIEQNTRYVSVVSAIELAIKSGGGGGRLPAAFQTDFSDAFRTALDAAGAEIEPVTLEDTARLARLPPIHRDPFDRLIIAQALERGLTVVTADARFADYPGLNVLDVA